MMLLEKIISPLAPFYCISCGNIGFVLCPACQLTSLDSPPPRCYRCHKATSQSQVCLKCRKTTPLKHVWVSANYTGLAKEVVDMLKFERAGSSSKDIARCLADTLPLLPDDTIVSHVPTAPKRIRIRGYDQARLIAQSLAKQRGYAYQPLCSRLTNSRQLGAGRTQRIKQAENAFILNKRYEVKDKNILIIDDVTTSGATIEAVARLLKDGGAKTIDAAVFAQAVD